MQPLKENVSATSMREIQAHLEQLERRDWWRWATAISIMLSLALALLALAPPEVTKNVLNKYQLDMAIPGLLGLVVIFSFFAIYQQVRISRMRRQLAGQIGMLAALEVLTPATSEEQDGWKERRRAPRYPFDQRLKVKTVVDGQEGAFYGRIIDVSELGIGAVISGSLQRGEKAVLEFNFNSGSGNSTLSLAAVTRYARGFRHGFEFSSLSAAELDNLRACIAESAAARR